MFDENRNCIKHSLKVNHHLLKTGPLYETDKYTVKLVKAVSYNTFTAEIMTGEHKEKWTTVYRDKLRRLK